jgi:hypothetical protein
VRRRAKAVSSYRISGSVQRFGLFTSLTISLTDAELFEQLYDAKKETKNGDGSSEKLDPVIDEETRRKDELQAEWKVLLEETANSCYPLSDEAFVEARCQPKSSDEEAKLIDRYHSIESTEERAFQILLDLGMIQESTPVNIEKFNEILSW